ncbi:MAG: hypothetical protein JWR07_3280, partial [Nevskia sp.]|nr:hypothetical protein [Nevskia sp.]
MSSVSPIAEFRVPPAGGKGNSSAPAAAIAPIAVRDTVDGPLSTSRLRRTFLLYVLLALTGLVLALSAGPALRAGGLGLMLPGGGFLGHLGGGLWPSFGAVAGLLLTLLLFGAALFAWFGSGNIIAPVAVWLGAALLAAATAPAPGWSGAPWLLAAAIVAAATVMLRGRARYRARAIADRDRRNAHLAKLAAQPTAPATVARPDAGGVPEEAAGYLRHILDRALQPLERFDGFDSIDQFQTASIRYQVCNFGYTLAALQYEHLPAFRGYLAQAQQNLHLKMLDHRNWKYWALENAWGNLSLDPDPVPRDNIMYSGWFGAMLAEYISNTGDSRYNDSPLVLRHP